MTSKAGEPDFSQRFYPSRPKLREASLILPKTGERVRRAVTFDHSPDTDGANSHRPDENSPLLGRRTSRRLGRDGSWKITHRIWEQVWKPVWCFVNSRTGWGVFKCSVAYFLGSLATFVPFLAATLGQQDGKHMVATITVYFHPARSKGSMFEAILYAILAFLYAVFICFASMGVSILFGQKLDLIILGHVLVLVFFCGGGLGFVGWIKQRLGNPLVNIACSLTSLAIIIVLTKEGAVQAAQFSDDKVVQVMLMIIMGVVMTTLVSFLISPVSARQDLQENIIRITDSFAQMLTIITQSFLTGSEEELHQDRFVTAQSRNEAELASLLKNLRESKFEHYAFGTERQHHLEAKLVTCMQRLSHSLGGLRSAAATQFLLLSQPPVLTPMSSVSSPLLQRTASFSFLDHYDISLSEGRHKLTAIDKLSDEGSVGDTTAHLREDSVDGSSIPSLSDPASLFHRFIAQLGPSMKSLAFTLRQILDELPGEVFPHGAAVNVQFRSSLNEAVNLYTSSREDALSTLYRSKDLDKIGPIELQADLEEVAASCGHFSFSLKNFAKEMDAYLAILDDLKHEIDERPKGRTWGWLHFWHKNHGKPNQEPTSDPEFVYTSRQDNTDKSLGKAANPLMRSTTSTNVSAKRMQSSTFAFHIRKTLRVFERDDIKFAIKVGVGAALYALPSFIPSNRPFYQHWRGEWGLLSYMLVCSMTKGASNTTGFARVLGTCIGAICAIVAWFISQGNPFLLAALGWIMSYWTAYVIVAQGKGPMGRFIMLTYNLSALYAYSLSVKDLDHDEDEGGVHPYIAEITLHRVLAVLSGCLWGLIVTRLIWPISARQKFKDGLSLLWLRMALIWKRDPLASFLSGETLNPYMDIREELELHRFLARLDSLRTSAKSEIDLGGPFPNEAYGRIVQSTGSMLDAFHAMKIIIMKDPKASDGEAEILRYTINERAELCSRISHLFHVLASSMKLEYPVNEALPSIEHTRDRLLAKIFRFRQTHHNASRTQDGDFALLYAFALITGQLSKDIHNVETEIGALFGILNEEMLKLQ